MAIQWGAWEGSGNEMRVGIDVDWETITHGETAATATVKYYTENRYSWSDDQTLNLSGAIDGTVGFHNGSGDGAVVLRSTKTYTYTYPSSSYGSSPGTRTFSATLSGAYNGITPSKSVTSNIPARPLGAPLAPTNAAVSRISDTSARVTWTNRDTNGEPWTTVRIHRDLNDDNTWALVTTLGSAATAYTDSGISINSKYRYRVRAENSAGDSAWDETGLVFTAPATPVSITRTPSGSDQVIGWANTGMGYSEYSTEILGYKNDVYQGVLGTVASGGTTFTHTPSNVVSPYTAGDRWKYALRHRTTSGPLLYSYTSAYSSETGGTSSPPSAPTNLYPTGSIVIDPTKARDLTWQHNPTDGSTQTQFQVRHRIVGAGSWTTESVVTSALHSWTLPANTYVTGNTVEWQVSTRGADAAFSAFSASATIVMAVSKKIPATYDLITGIVEADLTGYDWAAPSLLNSWVNFGAPFSNALYCRRGGVVRLKGVVKLGTISTGSTGNIFVLPVGFRPPEEMVFTTLANNAIARVELLTDGSVRAYSMASNAWLSLDGISFVVNL
jgi:hypothetical protein